MRTRQKWEENQVSQLNMNEDQKEVQVERCETDGRMLHSLDKHLWGWKTRSPKDWSWTWLSSWTPPPAKDCFLPGGLQTPPASKPELRPRPLVPRQGHTRRSLPETTVSCCGFLLIPLTSSSRKASESPGHGGAGQLTLLLGKPRPWLWPPTEACQLRSHPPSHAELRLLSANPAQIALPGLHATRTVPITQATPAALKVLIIISSFNLLRLFSSRMEEGRNQNHI